MYETLAKSANCPNGKNPVKIVINKPTPIVVDPGIPLLFNIDNCLGNSPSLLIVYRTLTAANIVPKGPDRSPITAPKETTPANLP